METSLGQLLVALDHQRSLARHQLAELTGLTRASVSAASQSLLGHGLIVETRKGAASRQGGPRPTYLEIEKGALNFIGLDLRRERFTGCLIDMGGRVLASTARTVQLGATTELALGSIHAILEELEASAKAPVVSVGVGSVGPISARDGVILSENFAALNGIPIVDLLSRNRPGVTNLRIGAVAATYGEERIAAENSLGAKSVAFVVIDYAGIGLGLISQGEAWETDHGGVGELGHMVIDPSGPRCTCGRSGCLVQYASGRALLRRCGFQEETPAEGLAMILAEAEAGNERMQGHLMAVGEKLGGALVNMDRLLRPERIAIGSSHEGLADWYFRGVRSYAQGLPDTIGGRALLDRMFLCARGSTAIAYGAAALQLKSFLRQPEPVLDEMTGKMRSRRTGRRLAPNGTATI